MHKIVSQKNTTMFTNTEVCGLWSISLSSLINPIQFHQVRTTHEYSCALCITYSMLKAAQATIIPLFSESYDAFKTSVSVGFPGNACTHWTSVRFKYYHVSCTIFFDRHHHHDIQIIWIWKQINRKVIVIYVLVGKYSVIVCYVDLVVILQSTDIWGLIYKIFDLTIISWICLRVIHRMNVRTENTLFFMFLI